jgi:hypothetical protein
MPETPVHRREVRRRGKLGGKPGGGGAHREAEVVAMAAPNPAGWHGVWCPRLVTRACARGKRGGGGARARTKGERGGGRRLLNQRRERERERERVWHRGERRRRGSARVRHVEEGEGRRGGPAVMTGGSGQPATTPIVESGRRHAVRIGEPGG